MASPNHKSPQSVEHVFDVATGSSMKYVEAHVKQLLGPAPSQVRQAASHYSHYTSSVVLLS